MRVSIYWQVDVVVLVFVSVWVQIRFDLGYFKFNWDILHHDRGPIVFAIKQRIHVYAVLRGLPLGCFLFLDWFERWRHLWNGSLLLLLWLIRSRILKSIILESWLCLMINLRYRKYLGLRLNEMSMRLKVSMSVELIYVSWISWHWHIWRIVKSICPRRKLLSRKSMLVIRLLRHHLGRTLISLSIELHLLHSLLVSMHAFRRRRGFLGMNVSHRFILNTFYLRCRWIRIPLTIEKTFSFLKFFVLST